jgi:two-component system, chemotaxis family, protein-glutamate methylesterase/glutaminase
MNLKAVVADDTIVYRRILSDALAAIPGVDVVGTAGNGKIALSQIKALQPDLLTLDMEMPEMNGLEVLEAIRRDGIDVGVILVSSLTTKGGALTMKALDLGAFDFITKPENGSTDDNKENIRKALLPLIKIFAHQREIRTILRSKGAAPIRATVKPGDPKEATPGSAASVVQRISAMAVRAASEVLAIGVSTGGPNALGQMLPSLPANISVPILIVQHMPPVFTQSLASSLDARCAFTVKEAENGEPVRPNCAYIAPGGKQMKVTLGGDASTKIIRVTDDPPENNCKPSVDYLFRSVAHHYLGRATGVIMTGMGNDGTLGSKLMKRNGCVIIAQDEASCVVFGMPKEVIAAGVADVVAPLDRIAGEIVRTIKRAS